MLEVRIDGLTIAYAAAGRGPPLVLLHGGIDDSRSWRWQVEGLADTFRVLAWDAPGCGRSSEPPESWRMPDYADCLAAWLDAIGIKRAHVLGLSWGSSLALEFYGRHPDRAVSLILASAYAGWAGSLAPDEVAARLESVLAAADLSSEDLPELWSSFVADGAPPELVHELTAIWADNAGERHPAGYRAMARSMAEADLRPVLPRIAVPTLLLYGDRDERSPLAVATELRDQIPSSKLVVIPGAGHASNAEAPEEFNRAVREFLQGIG